jgi:polyisoprenoid-binding protein YceI
MTKTLSNLRVAIGFLVMAAALSSYWGGQVPVFEILIPQSKISFAVKSSINLVAVFEKWNATFRPPSADPESGDLQIVIQAASVNAGSKKKNSKLKSQDFFDAKHHPLITFISTKTTPIGPDKYRVDGNFTIRGVSKPEALNMTLVRQPDGLDRIEGQMTFDRREFGMTHNVPFVKIGNSVQVSLSLVGRRISGPPEIAK